MVVRRSSQRRRRGDSSNRWFDHEYAFDFRKQGDLRLIGHRDLMRCLERLFRRAGLALGMSQGFHPKPRMTFPLALAVGIEGDDEVMELELTEPPAADELLRAAGAAGPAGAGVPLGRGPAAGQPQGPAAQRRLPGRRPAAAPRRPGRAHRPAAGRAVLARASAPAQRDRSTSAPLAGR